MTTREPVIPAPEQRIRAFLDFREETNTRHPVGHLLHIDNEIDSLNDDARLTYSDIRDVLNELESWRSRAEELEDKRREAITRYLSVHAHYNDDVRLAIEVLSDEP